MSNGNIYINASSGQGGSGVMYEVEPSGNIIWGPYQASTQKGFRYECNYPGIIALESYINTATTSCFSSVGVNNDIISNEISIYSVNHNTFSITCEDSNLSSIDVIVFNMLGQEIYSSKITDFNGSFNHDVNIENYQKGLFIVKLLSDNTELLTQTISFIN